MEFIIFVSTVIVKGGKILMIRERKPDYYGLFNLPGGHLEYGEDIIAGAKREVREEVDLLVEPEGLIGVFTDFGPEHYINFVFLATADGMDAKTVDGQILDHRWLNPEEILDLPDGLIINPRKIKRIVRLLQQKAVHSLAVIHEMKPVEAANYVMHSQENRHD